MPMSYALAPGARWARDRSSAGRTALANAMSARLPRRRCADKSIAGSAVPSLQRFAVRAKIESFNLVLPAHAQRQEQLDGLEKNKGQHAGPEDDSDHGVELDQHLSGVALNEPRRTLRSIRAYG